MRETSDEHYGPDTPLNTLAYNCHKTAVEHGFWDHAKIAVPDDPGEPRYAPDLKLVNPSIWAEKIALMHSEASEMLEALRDGKEDALGEECADLLIRLLDFTDARGIDLDYHVDRKMAKNRNRPHMHGRKF